MSEKPTPQQSANHQISIQSDTQTTSGVYSNLMMITHRKEEFVLDFLFVQPQRTAEGESVANLRSRVITSPEHIKRIVRALAENVRRYEEKFGPIQEATDMPKVIH